MSSESHIQWTDATWNVITGCSRVSEGCRFCYAERLAATRLAHLPAYTGLAEMTPGGPRWTGEVRFNEDKLDLPLRWQKPRMVFVNSQSDLFHEGLADDEIDQVFAAMAIASQHTFQILTKRPQRMRDYIGSLGPREGNPRVVAILNAMNALDPTGKRRPPLTIGHPVFRGPDAGYLGMPWPLPNVWLGTSVEDQATADERVPLLLDTPAAVRFVSAEPLLGPVNLTRLHYEGMTNVDALNGRHGVTLPLRGESAHLDWVIVGGESGPGARPMQAEWAASLIRQCGNAGVAMFMKQAGAVLSKEWECTDAKGHEPGEWPAEFRVRQFPSVTP